MTEAGKRENSAGAAEAALENTGAGSEGQESLAGLYRDEKQSSVEALARAAEAAREDYESYDFDTADVVKDVIFFFLTVALAFAWVLVMLLILSFITLSYLHFDIKWMFAVSVAAGIGAGAYYIRRMNRKYKGKRLKRRPRERKED